MQFSAISVFDPIPMNFQTYASFPVCILLLINESFPTLGYQSCFTKVKVVSSLYEP